MSRRKWLKNSPICYQTGSLIQILTVNKFPSIENIFRLELSLRYDTDHGRLTLGILLLRIFSLHTYNNDLGKTDQIMKWKNLKVMVRYLHQSNLVWGDKSDQGQKDPIVELWRSFGVQWKIQHPTSCQLPRQCLLCGQHLLQVQRWYSMLYQLSADSFNDHSYRNKFGVKAVLGRTNVGSFAFASGYPKKTNIYTKYYCQAPGPGPGPCLVLTSS